VRLVVDYAHNLAAYRGLIEACRATGEGRLVGVASAPGDRRDAELAEVGRLCAEGFDETIVYELDEDRGRARGDTARALMQGARDTGRPVREVLDVCEALRAGLACCRPGDTLVYACATQLSDVVAAFGDEALSEERSGPALRLAWSAEAAAASPLPASPQHDAAAVMAELGVTAGQRRRLPRLQEPS
jgi:cyanophycin synthetase